MADYSKILKKLHSLMTPTRTILLGFMAVILAGSFLLSLPVSNNDGNWLNYADSLFTSTSAVCVTGLVVHDTAVQFTVFGQLVILLLIQIGGLGFMTMATLIFILMGKKITLRDRLAIQESLVQFNLQGMVKLIRAVGLMTVVIEGAGALLLMISYIPAYGAKGIYYSIFHSVSAFCNAGFDLLGTQAAPYQGYAVFSESFLACFPLLMLIIIGGLGFTVIRDVIHTGKWHKFAIHTKVVLGVTGALIASGTLFFLIAEYNNPLTIGSMNFGDKLMNAFFQAVTPRTAGFATLNQADLTEASKFLTTVLMFIGAAPGSTAGGIKITVLFVLALMVINNLRGRNQVILDKQEIAHKKVVKAVTILSFASFIVFTAALFLMLFEEKSGVTMQEALFEAVSAFSTVGLTMGITPGLSLAGKLLLVVTMFFGRVGPITVGLAINSRYGVGLNNNIKYSEAKIMIG